MNGNKGDNNYISQKKEQFTYNYYLSYFLYKSLFIKYIPINS